MKRNVREARDKMVYNIWGLIKLLYVILLYVLNFGLIWYASYIYVLIQFS